MTTRVLIGAHGTLRSPIHLPTPVRLIDVAMERDTAWAVTMASEERGLLVAISGDVPVDGVAVEADSVATLATGGTTLRVAAGGRFGRLRPLASK